jgi:hypothetical protein
MKRTSPRTAEGRLRRSPVLTSAVANASVPELRFIAMAPSESLMQLAREQDAVCRGLLELAQACSRVELERVVSERSTVHRVWVRVWRHGVERCGQAEHERAEVALRAAYTELVRHAVSSLPHPCSHAA